MKKSEVKQNRKRRRILIAFIMVLFTGIILTASTYAWFTANRTVTVSSIDVNVTTSTGLQISTDATSWKSLITNDDIHNASWAGVTNQLPTTGLNGIMAPISTVGETDGTTGFMNMYKGTIVTNTGTGNNILTAEKSTEKNGTSGDFVAFDLFFQSNEAHKIYLTEGSSVAATANGTNSGIQNAARVAFVVEGNVAYGSEPATAQALKEAQTPYIWEPNFDVHTAAGVDNARNTYQLTTTADGAGKLAYVGVKSNITKDNNILLNSKDTKYFADVTTHESPKSGIPAAARMNAFDIKEGITKVRVYMWVEGQDVDCEDKASGGSLSFNLAFSIDGKNQE